MSQQEQREQQKKYIEIAKDLFLIWDADGEGSLSPDELVKAFVQIGLSQDHHFAKKIMYSIKPAPAKGQNESADFEIKMRDFITIFRNDEVSENVIKMINNEVNFRKKMEIKGLKSKLKNCAAEIREQCSEGSRISISMKSDGVTVEIPLDSEHKNKIKIQNRKFLIREDNQLEEDDFDDHLFPLGFLH